jgi:hypothetical protein
VAALRAHGGADKEMQHAACAALSHLLRGDTRGDAAAAHALLAVLRGGASSPCAAAACSALGSLAANDAARLQITNAGGIEAVLTVLRTHVADVMLAAEACGAFGHLFGGHEYQPCTRASALAAAAATAIVAVLRTHPGSGSAQRQGCFALWSLARGGGMPSNAAHARAAGGVAAAVAALRARPTDALLQMHGCGAVAHLCVGDARACAEAGAAGAVEAVTRALRTRTTRDLRRSGCLAMRVLVETSAPNAAKAAAEGAAAALMRALQHSADSDGENWLGDACWALFFIVQQDARQADAPGGVEAVVATLQRATQARACNAAAMATALAAAAAAVGDGQVVLPLEAGMLAALLALIVGSFTRQDRAVRAGALEAVSAAAESDASTDDRASTMLQGLQPLLHDAAERHDAGSCAHPTCACCAGQRAAGCMCALPGCGARLRAAAAPSGRHKSLLRCGRCRSAAYCGAEHSHADWARHKKADCRRAHAPDN